MKRLDYFAVLFVLLISGGFFFYHVYGLVFQSLFLLFAFFYKSTKHGKVSKYNQFVFLFLGIIYLFNFIIHDPVIPSFAFNITISYILLLFSSSLIFSSISKHAFTVALFKIVPIMAAVSIGLELLVESGVIHPSMISANGASKYTFLLHVFGNPNGLWERLAGIYWEPGAYQVILSTTIFLCLDEAYAIKESKHTILKFLVLLVAIVMTKSTAGYLTLMFLMLFASSRFLKEKKKWRLVSFFGIFLAFAVIFPIIIQSETIQGKFAQEGNEGTSYAIRYNDNMGMLQMIKEKPLVGYGLGESFSARSSAVDNQASSNGILKMTSNYGIIYLLIILYFVSLCSKEYNSRRWVVLSFFILINFFEVFMFFPFMGIFYFKFLRERNCIV